MIPAQQQIVAQFNQMLQQTGAQLDQLLQQAGAGCQQMIAQNPTDPTPLANAIGAIDQQVRALVQHVKEEFDATDERIRAVGPLEPAFSQTGRAERWWRLWADEAWTRFENHWHVEQYRAMWPMVQEAMAEQVGCSRCGAPLSRKTPYKNESISCQACRTVNQVMPAAVVARYFAGMPHQYAEHAVLDKKANLRRFEAQWEDHCDAEEVAEGDRPEEPLERLKQREQMELEIWTAYAGERVRNEGGTAEDAKTLADTRMSGFYSQVNRKDVWRRAHGVAPLASEHGVPRHLENVDDWGPLDPHANPNALEDNFVHETLLKQAARDPQEHAQLLRQLGYRDDMHREIVARTFLRHYDKYLASPEGRALVNRAVMRSINEGPRLAVAAASSGVLDPIEGVAIAVYAGLQAKQATASPAEFQKMLAQHQMDKAKWERVAKGWIDRMTRDRTGAVSREYSQAFMRGGQNQFAAAGAAAADVMGQGQMGLAAPAAGAEPASFEKYCEISGAMQAWTKQGKDISVMLDKTFKITSVDVSTLCVYWGQKAMVDLSIIQRQQKVMEHYERQYLAMA
jgi:hypothetical protein